MIPRCEGSIDGSTDGGGDEDGRWRRFCYSDCTSNETVSLGKFNYNDHFQKRVSTVTDIGLVIPVIFFITRGC